MINKYQNVFLLIIIFIISGCTKNPFFEDKIIYVDRQTISGNVSLEGVQDYSGTLVYMDGFDIFTKTDRQGNFEITIPEPHTQPNEGLSAVYNIFYYVANYKLEYSTVFVSKGEFAYGIADLSIGGKISTDIMLKKMLDVRTAVFPEKIKDNYSGKVKIEVSLRNMVDSVVVFSHLNKKDELSSAYLSSADTVHLIFLPSNLVAVVIDSPKVWEMEINWITERDFVKPNDYKVIPYLQIYQPEIPIKLVEYFGINATRFTENFLEIPFRRKTANFKVSSADN